MVMVEKEKAFTFTIRTQEKKMTNDQELCNFFTKEIRIDR